MSNRFSWHSELFPAKLTRNDLVNALEATDLDQLASELHRLSIINANTILSMSTRSKTQQLLTHLDEKCKIRNAYSLQVVGALSIFWYRDESVRMLLTAKAKELGRPALTPVASKSSSKATVTAKTTSEIDLQTYQELQATIAKLQGDLNDRGKQLETQAITQQQLIDDNSKALKQLGDARKRAESLGAGAKSAKDEVDRLTKDVKQLKQQAKDWQAIGEAKESKLVEAMSKANIVAGEMSGLQAKQEKMEKAIKRLWFSQLFSSTANRSSVREAVKPNIGHLLEKLCQDVLAPNLINQCKWQGEDGRTELLFDYLDNTCHGEQGHRMLVRLHALLLPLPNVKHLLRTPNHRYESAVKSDPEQRIQELEAELERQRTTSKATQLHLETVQEELVATRERLANSEGTTAELKVKVRSLEAQVEQSGAGTNAKSGGWQGGQ